MIEHFFECGFATGKAGSAPAGFNCQFGSGIKQKCYGTMSELSAMGFQSALHPL